MSFLTNIALSLTEKGLLPDTLVRAGIRRLCLQRLDEERARGQSNGIFAAEMRRGPVAPLPEKANEQHYEVPPEFFDLVLGARRKYSCCLWEDGVNSLDDAERRSLEETCSAAGIEDGMDILELGCGWGSLSLWMALRYPNARITSVSNSAPQRRFIQAEASRIGVSNLAVLTADMNNFSTERRFDRVVSVEMFEHMRNYDELLRRVSSWLRPDGRLFVHIFVHNRYAYAFEEEDSSNWLGRYFFSGGIMPSVDLLSEFDRDMRVIWRRKWNGRQYERTANAWLKNLDNNRQAVMPILARVYGQRDARKWFIRWRVFFMACAELWGFDQGREWFVAHYLLERVPFTTHYFATDHEHDLAKAS